MESLRMQLQSLEDKCAAKSTEISRLRDESTEIGEDMAACRRKAWLPDGYSRIFRIVCVWPFGLLGYGSATLRCKI